MCAIFVPKKFILVSKSQTLNDRLKVNGNSSQHAGILPFFTFSSITCTCTINIIFFITYQPLPVETCIKSEPESSVLSAETTGSMVNPSLSPDSPSKQKKLAEAIDVLNANPPGTPNVRLKGFYIYHSDEVIAVTVHFPFLVHVCQSIFTNETKVICMYIYIGAFVFGLQTIVNIYI